MSSSPGQAVPLPTIDAEVLTLNKLILPTRFHLPCVIRTAPPTMQKASALGLSRTASLSESLKACSLPDAAATGAKKAFTDPPCRVLVTSSPFHCLSHPPLSPCHSTYERGTKCSGLGANLSPIPFELGPSASSCPGTLWNSCSSVAICNSIVLFSSVDKVTYFLPAATHENISLSFCPELTLDLRTTATCRLVPHIRTLRWMIAD